MKLKVIFIAGIVFSSTIMANPIVTTLVKEVVKKVSPKVAPIVTTLIATASELGAEEIEEKTMSKKELDLYKTKF